MGLECGWDFMEEVIQKKCRTLLLFFCTMAVAEKKACNKEPTTTTKASPEINRVTNQEKKNSDSEKCKPMQEKFRTKFSSEKKFRFRKNANPYMKSSEENSVQKEKFRFRKMQTHA